MINVFTASGHIGKDMELRYTQNQKPIGSFSLPVKQGFGEHENTSWVGVKIFGKRAEALNGKLLKGTPVFVTGEFVLEEWEKDGQKHSYPVILCREIHIVQRSESGGPLSSDKPDQKELQTQDGFDDDIPF